MNQARSLRKISTKREQQAAADIGGHTCPASGALEIKGDARNGQWMVEDKFTKSASYSLRAEVFQKARVQAMKTGRKPVMKVGLPKCEMAVISWSDFCDLISEEEIC